MWSLCIVWFILPDSRIYKWFLSLCTKDWSDEQLTKNNSTFECIQCIFSNLKCVQNVTRSELQICEHHTVLVINVVFIWIIASFDGFMCRSVFVMSARRYRSSWLQHARLKRIRKFLYTSLEIAVTRTKPESYRQHYGGLKGCLLSDWNWISFVNSAERVPHTMSGGSQHNPNGRQSQLGAGWSPLQVVLIIPLIITISCVKVLGDLIQWN